MCAGKLTRLTTAILLIAPVAGCGMASEYCLLTEPILFDSREAVASVMEADPELVRQVVSHNEVRERICP